jgi:two-component system NtrC family response regulator
MDCMMQYDWPGNVRELINVLQTAIAEATSEQVLYPHHLPQTVRIDFYKKTTSNRQQAGADEMRFEVKQISGFDGFPAYKEFRTAASAVAESAYLDEVIKRSGNKAGEAIRLAGISRANLYRRLMYTCLFSPPHRPFG